MAITGSVDLGDGVLAVTVDHDPTAVATDVPAGSLIITAAGDHHRKLDDGSTTNVTDKISIKDNLTATSDPTVNDDVDLGYEVGSRWVNTTSGEAFICVDATDGAAVWTSTTGVAAHAADHGNAQSDELEVESLGTSGTAGTVPVVQGDGSLAMQNAPIAASADTIRITVLKGSAGTINKGEPVYIAGWNVGQALLEVELAQADAMSTMPALGIADGAITNTVSGEIVFSGTITGLDTSSFSVNDALYIDAASPGVLVNAAPQGANEIQKMAEVARSHASQGVIEISGAGRINALPNLPDGMIWVGDANGVPQAVLNAAGSKVHLYADSFNSPNNADWAVNALAPLNPDSINAALKIRPFDDTAEEGVGFMLRVPTGATNVKFTLMSRAQATGAGNVVPQVYEREVADAGAPTAWSAGVDLSALVFGANTNYNEDTETVTLASLGLGAGQLHQIELTRSTGAGGDTLVGDWDLSELVVEFT